VNAHVHGVNLDTVGVILMIAGGAVVLFGLLYDAVWADRTRGRRVVERID
jgi:hypothetical protein